MLRPLDRAIERVKSLPVEMQEQAADILMAFVGDDQPLVALTPEEVVDLTAAQEERRRGDFATDAEVEAALVKYRR